MRRALVVPLALCSLVGVTFAQVKQQDPNQTQSASAAKPKSERVHRAAHRSSSSFQSMLAYGSFALGDEERFGPMMLLQYSFNRTARPQFDLFAGILFRTGSSTPIDEREYVPLASSFVSYYSLPSDYYYDDPYYLRPHLSIGVAFLGADVAFYLTEGEVRPYFGLGASFAFWSYQSRLSGTVTPNVKAGLDVRMSNSLSAFVEARRMFGVPTFIGPETPKFDGLTAAAVGLSYAPRLR